MAQSRTRTTGADAPPRTPAGWRVVDAQFVTSAPTVDDCPADELPEFALAGRSNVGKSSLLNALCGRRGLARVSRTPGRTQLLNVFELALSGPGAQRRVLRCVDLPGYGYAAAHRKVREGFAPMIEGYLAGRRALRALVLLIDARRGELSELDLQLLELATAHGHPALLVATKVDRIGASERGLLRRRLGAAVGARPSDVLLTSASANLGLSGPDGLAADLAALAEPIAEPIAEPEPGSTTDAAERAST
ncbi:ribosome biogenesis GTP-binding protein YihA/YsxC [Paraliomyxa miuraensis]|uniref:ribosome biogenesis GTP-binding protein YihA/YsxC n=1 Tax=Paraliomyxa miuraensis TaxID=376150 RepID=UPI00225A3F76|nr:ribosome biogenesis GTP-binding protein YihA/YsxC [Paraliomyxa miuraensis]MCX4242379.1 ribosome biogenesis GTP-binding protein YihA/YsxC [Paraliomyxa miuraensis]